MDIAILNYPTGEVDIIRGIDVSYIDESFGGDVELYLDEQGYNIHDIHYMCAEYLAINN